MSLFARTNKEVIPEYEKSLLSSWKTSTKGKQSTPAPAQILVKVVKVPQKSQKAPARSPPRDASTSPPKHAAPLYSASSTCSSLSTLSSSECSQSLDEADSDTRPLKKPRFSDASSSRTLSQMSIDASQVADFVTDASLPVRRVRPAEDTPPNDFAAGTVEDGSIAEPSPKRLKLIKDVSTRSSSILTMSADSSRASSPALSGKSSGTKRVGSASKGKSRNADASSGGTVKRRKKRALTDLTLPPKKGTYQSFTPPVMVRSGSTSRSTTACESDGYVPPRRAKVERVTWAMEDGNVGDELLSSEFVVRQLVEQGRYKTFFKNPNDPNDLSYDLSSLPTVELEYPMTGAKESFLLARPKDVDHYDPTLDIENTLRTFVKDFVPPEHRYLFGPFPEDALHFIVDSDDDEGTKATPEPAELFATVNQSSVIAPSLESLPSTLTTISSDTDDATLPPFTSPSRGSPAPKSLMKTLIRARHRKDGPTFTETLKEINKCIRELKEHTSGENILRKVPYTWSSTGVPQGVVLRIIEEAYQRCIGPKMGLLRKYEAFSSNVYGELTPAFVTDIIKRTGLNSESLLIDLGSGVGNVVLQAALETGCTTFGIEEREDTARIADEHHQQVKLRCRMWGVNIGNVELCQGDMTASPRVDELMGKADVVLVNNYVFSEELNASLRPKFLDLKEGATVVSLKPFAPPGNQMLTERNFDDLSAIFDVFACPYRSGTVSWSGGSGMYYIHHVNREGYRKNREAFESLRRGERRRGRR